MREYPRPPFKDLASRQAERIIRNIIGLREPPMPDQAKRQVLLFTDLDCLGTPKFERFDDTHRLKVAIHRCEDRLPTVYLPQYYVKSVDVWHDYYDHPYVLAYGSRDAALDFLREALNG